MRHLLLVIVLGVLPVVLPIALLALAEFIVSPPRDVRPLKTTMPDQVRRPEIMVVVTTATEVYLDGKPVKFEDVPEGAVVEEAALEVDGKTVKVLKFRSKGK